MGRMGLSSRKRETSEHTRAHTAEGRQETDRGESWVLGFGLTVKKVEKKSRHRPTNLRTPARTYIDVHIHAHTRTQTHTHLHARAHAHGHTADGRGRPLASARAARDFVCGGPRPRARRTIHNMLHNSKHFFSFSSPAECRGCAGLW